jgi:hypothetical protein
LTGSIYNINSKRCFPNLKCKVPNSKTDLKKENLLAGFKCKQLFHTFSGEADPSPVTAEEPANKYKEAWMN